MQTREYHHRQDAQALATRHERDDLVLYCPCCGLIMPYRAEDLGDCRRCGDRELRADPAAVAYAALDAAAARRDEGDWPGYEP